MSEIVSIVDGITYELMNWAEQPKSFYYKTLHELIAQISEEAGVAWDVFVSNNNYSISDNIKHIALSILNKTVTLYLYDYNPYSRSAAPGYVVDIIRLVHVASPPDRLRFEPEWRRL